MSEQHKKFQELLENVNDRDAELRKNVWLFQQMHLSVTKSAEQILTAEQTTDIVCKAQENILSHLDELEKQLDGEFGEEIDNEEEDVCKDQNYFNLVKLQK